MVLGCKGLCGRLETTGGGKHSAYGLGYKRCSACGVFIKTDERRCPCCRLPLLQAAPAREEEVWQLIVVLNKEGVE